MSRDNEPTTREILNVRMSSHQDDADFEEIPRPDDMKEEHHPLPGDGIPLDERRIPFSQAEGMKDSNPKDVMGIAKLPMHLVPGSAKSYMTMAFLEGAMKYGKYNWRITGVKASIYMDALERHYEKYKNGEDADSKTGVPHLASIMACCSIILDADLCDKLTDDRPPRAPMSKLIDSLASQVVKLQGIFKDHSPHQFTIDDGPEAEPPSLGTLEDGSKAWPDDGGVYSESRDD